MYVLGHYLAVRWTNDQLGILQRVLHGAAKCCGISFGSRCRPLCKSLILDPAKESETITLPPLCFIVGVTHTHTHKRTILSPTQWCTKTLPVEQKISNCICPWAFLSSVDHWRCFMAQASLFFLVCHLSNGFLTGTWPVKPAAWSLLFTVKTETCLLRSVLSCAWRCSVSCLSHKLLTLRNLSSDSVVALEETDRRRSGRPSFHPKCLLMV